eukprot:GAHX01002116.1.p1 GENE.GAHX01002116.1~~GAHX01002116.1.p1  ORF type:complete len:721 (-),score=129.79 GAHX01002116.1:46-2208(-)
MDFFTIVTLQLILVLLAGSLINYLVVRYNISIPYTILLSLASWGFLEICYLLRNQIDFCKDITSSVKEIYTTDSKLYIDVLIPGLLFVSSFTAKYHIFVHEKFKVFMLAVPGVLVSSFLFTGLVLIYPTQGTWLDILMSGSILSATDPVSVVSILQGFSDLKNITTLIEGESMLNDGTAIIFASIVDGYRSGEGGNSVYSFFRTIFFDLILPFILGYFIAVAARFITNLMRFQYPTSIIFLLSTAYFLFLLSEYTIGSSGILSLVFYGLILSKNRDTLFVRKNRLYTESFLSLLEFVLNSLLFYILVVLVHGTILDVYLEGGRGDKLLALILESFYYFLVVNMSRYILVIIFSPIFLYTGYKNSAKELVILALSGLKGFISVSLALTLFTTKEKEILFKVILTSFMTLIINGLLVKLYIFVFNMNKKDDLDIMVLEQTKSTLNDLRDKYIFKLKNSKTPVEPDWGFIEAKTIKFKTTHINKTTKSNSNTNNKKAKIEEDINLEYLTNNKILFRLINKQLLKLEDHERISSGAYLDLKHYLELAEDNNDISIITKYTIDNFGKNYIYMKLSMNNCFMKYFSSLLVKPFFKSFERLFVGIRLFQKLKHELVADEADEEVIAEIESEYKKLIEFLEHIKEELPFFCQMVYSILVIRIVLSKLKNKLKLIHGKGILNGKDYGMLVDKIEDNLNRIVHSNFFRNNKFEVKKEIKAIEHNKDVESL